VLGAGVLLLQHHEQWLMFGSRQPTLFRPVAWSFVAVAPVALYFALRRRPAFHIQFHALLSFDIIALGLLMHASGGLASGFGVLIAVSLAIGSLAGRGVSSMAFATLASIAMLVELSLAHIAEQASKDDFFRAGLLITAFFSIALLAHVFTARLKVTEQKIKRQAVDLADLDAINEIVLELLDIGVVAVDSAGKIRAANETARRWLNTRTKTSAGAELNRLPPQVKKHYDAWRVGDPDNSPTTTRIGTHQLTMSFKAFPDPSAQGGLIMLRDTEQIRDEHHKTKLAAIGQMAASIAHEIRNPLSAIAQAAQMLKESNKSKLPPETIADIILRNSQRLNSSVENILALSRKRMSNQSPLELCSFVDDAAAQITALPSMSECAISVLCRETPKAVIDPTQLDEILHILCENAVQHSGAVNSLEIRIIVGIQKDGSPFIDISDNGGGIAPESAERIFEPFYSTAESSGLGLFLAKELCALNQASLRLMAKEKRGASFRITMSAA
jgi:two-component system sensor histidine kinase PilS (NtrC family)